MDLATLAALNAERRARRACVLLTDLSSGEQRLVRQADIAADPLSEALAANIASGKSGLIEIGEGRRLFAAVEVPPARIVAIGAVHISQALAPMARLLGHDVIVIDPRTAFASPDRFPHIELLAEWPQDVLPGLGIDRFTALAALTHDPKIDDPGLIEALEKQCFYVGALGSRKTHAARLQRLRERGLTDADLARIHAPIGLPIGAASPAEIALSILAEITASLRRKPEPARAGA